MIKGKEMIEKEIYPMCNTATKVALIDDEEQRSGIERRKFRYTAYSPERRSGDDRRGKKDFRKSSS